jgi:hypothetical protein
VGLAFFAVALGAGCWHPAAARATPLFSGAPAVVAPLLNTPVSAGQSSVGDSTAALSVSAARAALDEPRGYAPNRRGTVFKPGVSRAYDVLVDRSAVAIPRPRLVPSTTPAGVVVVPTEAARSAIGTRAPPQRAV